MPFARRKAHAMAVACMALAILAILRTSEAAALTYQDIAGKWCTGAGFAVFTPDSLKIFRASDRATFNFRIVRYDVFDTEITVNWIQNGKEVNTKYAHFSSDGQSMVQLANEKGPERPHRRCR